MIHEVAEERIQFSAAYADAGSYNSTGRPEAYKVDVPATFLTDFNRLFYYLTNQTLMPNTWLGVHLIKYPTDLFICQELLVELKPDLVIECGTFNGGSALFMASILDAMGHGQIETIDVLPQPDRPIHPRINYIVGSSTDPAIVERLREMATGTTLVILDSDHRAVHVRAELAAYAPIASYLIVEDTNINGHPIRPDFGPGPFEAVQEFLASPEGAEWEMDRQRERLILTVSPGGFLRRKTPKA